ncbi:copper-translocating P-type ATPase [Dolosicoccus paucivorans]|uniref:heavy metal translocating P-type ATPase n=1 Tax=Dolosicoccus paucivorans TaxID=84521 RepID=UPI000C80EC01|nr:heavy metal translocating P-type ATPase [Dolosicoccus paucivorans]PMB83766.1 copper-translocating P-type ATPase [Dolosicoccus paucivorans]
MQRFLFENKQKITLISGVLIIIALFNHWFIGLNNVTEISFIIASIIGVLPIAFQAWGALKVKVISIDLLVTIAVIGAFIIQNFEESAIVTFLFLFGSYLEQRTLNHTRSAIKELLEMAPESALKLMDDGEFHEVDIDEVELNDTLLVKTGARIPVDGTVLNGEGHINEASITGEPDLISKEKGREVFAGTILENGTLQIIAEKVGEDTTFGKIIELVEEAQDSKSEAERFIDSFAKYYTPAVLVLAFLTWFFTRNVELAITVLVLGCPGALVIGIPVSNVAGIGNGAKNGVLLKGSEVIKDFSQADTIIFDKTGTLTIGQPEVSKALFYAEDKTNVIDLLVSVEKESDHPLAKAIVQKYSNAKTFKVDNTHLIKGGGVVAKVEEHQVVIGNMTLMEQEGIKMTSSQRQAIDELIHQGNSIVLTGIDGHLVAVMGIEDQIRPQAKEVIQALKDDGVKNLVMLSGDNQQTVDLVSQELGLTEGHGGLLPKQKSEYVQQLIDQGHTVAFVGDGVNDSPSLALAQVGIAMGGGTDVAIETSDVVLMNSNIQQLPYAVELTKATSRNMIQNIIIAVGVVGLLLYGLLFADWVNMTLGMLVHEGSILLVILNGMRLLKFRS